MTKTFEWNGFLVQVLEDSIEIKPKIPADSSIYQQEYLHNIVPAPVIPHIDLRTIIWSSKYTGAWPTIAESNRIWKDDGTLEAECEEIKSEPTDSKKE